MTDARFFRVLVWYCTVGIELTRSNASPALLSVSVQTVNEETTLSFTNKVADPDLPFNTLTFSLLPGAPPGVSVNPTNGVLTWTPTEAQGPSTNLIGVAVTANGSPPLSATNFLILIVNEVNRPPVLIVPGEQTGGIG